MFEFVGRKNRDKVGINEEGTIAEEKWRKERNMRQRLLVPSLRWLSRQGHSQETGLRIFSLMTYFCIATSFPSFRVYVTQWWKCALKEK